MTSAGRRWRAAVLLALALATLPTRAQVPAPARDVIVLVGANTFADGDRVGRRLAAAAAATDVLGPARFEILAVPGGRPAELAPRLRERLARSGDVRAVVAVLGDLTLLSGVAPSEPPAPRREISSREPRTGEALAARRDLEAAARAAGAEFLAATAPLGRQGRIEVPELLDFAASLRATGPLLDLQATFRAHEDRPGFGNGIDRLDDYGHDELARQLLPALLDALPPRQEDECIARVHAQALAAFAQGRVAEWRELLPQVDAAPARSPRAQARRAALLSAADGLAVHAADWAAIEPGGDMDVPGLAAARALCALPESGLAPGDPIEQALLAVAQAVAAGSTRASELAAAAVDSSPERLEAWLGLQLASTTVGPPRDWRGPARRTLRLFDRGPVSVAQAELLLDAWPGALDALPALLCASRASLGELPVGPLLDSARRRAALGFDASAAQLLRDAEADQRLPPSWRALAELWEVP